MATVPKLDIQSAAEPTVAVERHFTPAEVAESWKVSADTLRRTFEREPGVLVIGIPISDTNAGTSPSESQSRFLSASIVA